MNKKILILSVVSLVSYKNAMPMNNSSLTSSSEASSPALTPETIQGRLSQRRTRSLDMSFAPVNQNMPLPQVNQIEIITRHLQNKFLKKISSHNLEVQSLYAKSSQNHETESSPKEE